MAKLPTLGCVEILFSCDEYEGKKTEEVYQRGLVLFLAQKCHMSPFGLPLILWTENTNECSPFFFKHRGHYNIGGGRTDKIMIVWGFLAKVIANG
jgi:hypothetical protein